MLKNSHTDDNQTQVSAGNVKIASNLAISRFGLESMASL